MYEFESPKAGSIPSADPKSAVLRRRIVASLFGAVALGALAGMVLKPNLADRPAAEQRPVRKVVSQDAWPDELTIVVDSRRPQTTSLPAMTSAPPSLPPNRTPVVETAYRPEPPTATRTRWAPDPRRETPERDYERSGPPDDGCVFVGRDEVVCGEAARPDDYTAEDYYAENGPPYRR